MMTSIFIIGTGIVMWVLFGYSLSFAPSSNGIIGDLSWIGLEGVSLTEGYIDGAAIPNMVFCRISDDVCNYYSCSYYRCCCGQNEV